MPERYDNIEVETIGDQTVVRFLPRSAVTEENLEPFRELLTRLAATPGAKVVIDFGNVQFLSSAALGVLILLHQRFQRAGGRLTVHALSPDLLDVFRLTKLDSLFGFDPDDDEGGSAGVPARLLPPQPSGGAAAALPPPAEPSV